MPTPRRLPFRALTPLVLFASVPALRAEGDLRVVLDVPYVQVATDNDHRTLDIYTDELEEGKRRPVVVFIHGGGWYAGEKERVHGKPDWLVAEGFAFVSVGYRLTAEGDRSAHPNNVADIAAAIAWLRAHVADYGGDPESLYLMGHSSGAHLAALVATDGRYLDTHGLSLAALSGVVAIDTDAYDLERLIRAVEPPDRELYLAAFGRHPVTWRDASPMTHVRPGKAIPPFLLLDAGGHPRKVAQVEAFERRLEAAGVPVTLEIFPHETHGSISARMGRRGHGPSKAVLRFLKLP